MKYLLLALTEEQHAELKEIAWLNRLSMNEYVMLKLELKNIRIKKKTGPKKEVKK